MISNDLVALKTLTSVEHANSIDYNIMNITWNLGKRCNYDCSYCSPSVHDWVSPHILPTTIKSFIEKLDNACDLSKKKYKISLTGGEPFVHPDILEILETMKNGRNVSSQLVAITNGSLPIETYQKALEFLSNLTISLHLERPDNQIESILEKIILLNQQFSDRWINVQVMCLPKKFDYITNYIIPTLTKNNIKHVLRRIRPPVYQELDDYKDQNKKTLLKKVFPIVNQTLNKREEKRILQNKIEKIYENEEFYTKEELEWVEKNIPTVFWQNIGVWGNDLEYYETNSDLVISKNQNSFTGWYCFIGIDGFMIDFDGKIYRGYCQHEGEIGDIFSELQLPISPTVCSRKFCFSNPDVTTRKAKKEHLHLITKKEFK